MDPALPQKVEKLENLVMGTKGQIEELSRITDNTSPSTLDKAELDDLLDEIDEVLETNAEDFVRSFVQKGGQ